MNMTNEQQDEIRELLPDSDNTNQLWKLLKPFIEIWMKKLIKNNLYEYLPQNTFDDLCITALNNIICYWKPYLKDGKENRYVLNHCRQQCEWFFKNWMKDYKGYGSVQMVPIDEVSTLTAPSSTARFNSGVLRYINMKEDPPTRQLMVKIITDPSGVTRGSSMVKESFGGKQYRYYRVRNMLRTNIVTFFNDYCDENGNPICFPSKK